VDFWVDHLNDRHVNWAWEIFMGCAEVYAQFVPPTEGLPSGALASIYYDFFDAWHNGSANHGIIGIMHMHDEDPSHPRTPARAAARARRSAAQSPDVARTRHGCAAPGGRQHREGGHMTFHGTGTRA
jgi:hypothetical protein